MAQKYIHTYFYITPLAPPKPQLQKCRGFQEWATRKWEGCFGLGDGLGKYLMPK